MSEDSTPPPATEPDEQREPQAQPKSKAFDPRLRSLILAAIGILLLVIVAWGGSLRTNQMRIAELERSVDALSEALEPSVLSEDTRKLERLVTDIAKAGGYREVSIADNGGKIIATTNSARLGQKSEAMRVSTNKAVAQKKDGQIKIRRAIILAGDTRYGNVEVVIAE